MGKIIAIGGGRYSDGEIKNILEYIASCANKENPSVLFLPTAGFDDIEGDEDIRDIFLGCGCSFDYLFLTDKSLTKEDIREKILNSDVIYVGGGNVEFMMNTWDETGASDILREAYEKGIIMSGYSAGAVCWFAEGYDDCGPDRSFIFCDCLGILPYSACPHFEGNGWYNFKDEIKNRPLSGVGIENGAALIYDNGTFSTMHGNDVGYVWFFNKDKNYEGKTL
ncbi:MAG: Type 1 glutamine amidotransferase-like domain-containing protein [Acutalibacteraceae bacterium]|nr:Type 1 glutamine amidotransferase-like domain-containing protein [Acutalibacteraceae bacterium]